VKKFADGTWVTAQVLSSFVFFISGLKQCVLRIIPYLLYGRCI